MKKIIILLFLYSLMCINIPVFAEETKDNSICKEEIVVETNVKLKKEQYRLSENESWSTTIPSGINAKTYTVYYHKCILLYPVVAYQKPPFLQPASPLTQKMNNNSKVA